MKGCYKNIVNNRKTLYTLTNIYRYRSKNTPFLLDFLLQFYLLFNVI